MNYFSRRNEYVVEYSGHEEASSPLRKRLFSIIEKYVGQNSPYGSGLPWFIDSVNFEHRVEQEFTDRTVSYVFKNGEFHEIFSIIEIFLDMTRGIDSSRAGSSFIEVLRAFSLSGSVYTLSQNSRIELEIDKDSAEKIDSMKSILAPYPEFSQRFFQAVANLVGRRAKPEDVVKDIFVAAEGYLKAVTGESGFGDAVKDLLKKNLINREQKKVLDAIHAFRSDADGAGHAGNSATPTEKTALWFLDTVVAQLRMIDKVIQK